MKGERASHPAGVPAIHIVMLISMETLVRKGPSLVWIVAAAIVAELLVALWLLHRQSRLRRGRRVWCGGAWAADRILGETQHISIAIHSNFSHSGCAKLCIGRPMSTKVEETWQNAFSVMKSNYALTDDGIGVFALNLRFNLDDIQTIVSEAITGGGDDKKCDVLYVDKERQIAIVAQCYVSKKAREAAPANKASDLNAALSWLLTSDLDKLPDGLKGRADELRNAIINGDVKQFYIWYVHNLPGSKNVKDELKTVEKLQGQRSRLSRLGRKSIFSQRRFVRNNYIDCTCKRSEPLLSQTNSSYLFLMRLR